MKRAAIIITTGDADELGRHHAQMPREPSEQLLADLRTLVTAGERYHGTDLDAQRAAARVRALLPKEKPCDE
jgi:hypothetical protein